MPTYTYRCAKCGDEFEVFQSMSDPPLRRCRKCRGALRRILQPVGIVLKGSGFHRNDYRSKPKPSSDGERKDSADKIQTPSDSKTETKSETKSETKTKSETSSESKGDSKAPEKGPSSD